MKAAAIVVGLSLTAATSACGDLGGRFRGSQIVRPPAVDHRALERYPPDSPQRAVLEWYGALQRNDAVTAARYYAAAAASPARLGTLIAGTRPFFARVGLGPMSVDVLRPRTATVVTELRVRWEAPNGRDQEVRTPQSFTLVRQGGRWLFTDTYFLGYARTYRPKKPRGAS